MSAQDLFLETETNKNGGIIMAKIYKTLDKVPSYYRDSVKKVIDKGALKGNEKGELNLSEDMCRIITIFDRLGKI